MTDRHDIVAEFRRADRVRRSVVLVATVVLLAAGAGAALSSVASGKPQTAPLSAVSSDRPVVSLPATPALPPTPTSAPATSTAPTAPATSLPSTGRTAPTLPRATDDESREKVEHHVRDEDDHRDDTPDGDRDSDETSGTSDGKKLGEAGDARKGATGD